MNRNQTFTNEQLSAKDTCNTNIYAMVGIAQLAEGILGEGPFLNNLQCTQATVPNLTVYLEPGEIYSMQNIDDTNFGPILADTTHQILKCGVLLDQEIIPLTAPATPGDSIIYLIQIEFTEVDDQSESRPYAGGSPSPTLTRRADLLGYSIKASTPAVTPTPPTPDAGFVGAWLVTVANGQTAILNANIVAYPNAPFIDEKLGDKISQTTAETLFPLKSQIQSGALTYASTSGTDTYTASLAPALAGYSTGMTLNINFATPNTVTNPTLNVNGRGAITIKNSDGTAILAGQCTGQRTLKYDGTDFLLQTSASDFINSKVANGYAYLPNGLIICWGTTSAIGNGATNSVTLPITFPNGGLNCQVTYINTSSSNTDGVPFAFRGFTSTSTIEIYNGGIGNAVYMYCAIGY